MARSIKGGPVRTSRAGGAGARYEVRSEAGFVRETLEGLREIDLKPDDLRDIVGADKRTIYRWYEGKSLSRLAHLERLRSLEEILRLARKAHGTHARDWFHAPNPHLGNLRPATLLKDASGLALIKEILLGSLGGGVA